MLPVSSGFGLGYFPAVDDNSPPISQHKTPSDIQEEESSHLFNYLSIQDSSMLPNIFGFAPLRGKTYNLLSPALTKNDLIKIFAKMNLFAFVRMKRTCTSINQFIADNGQHIKHKIISAELVVSPDLYHFGEPSEEDMKTGDKCPRLYPYAVQILKPLESPVRIHTSWSKDELLKSTARFKKPMLADELRTAFGGLTFDYLRFDLCFPHLGTYDIAAFMANLREFVKNMQTGSECLAICNHPTEAIHYLTSRFRPTYLRLSNPPDNIFSRPELLHCDKVLCLDTRDPSQADWECSRAVENFLPLTRTLTLAVFRDNKTTSMPTLDDHIRLTEKLNMLLEDWINGSKVWKLGKMQIVRMSFNDSYPEMVDLSNKEHILVIPKGHLPLGFFVKFEDQEEEQVCLRNIYLLRRRHHKGIMALTVAGFIFTAKIFYNFDEFNHYMKHCFPNDNKLNLYEMAASRRDTPLLAEYINSLRN